MKTIALEEAVIVPGQEHYVPEHHTHPEFADHFHALLDIGEQRIQAMDDGGIELSILSLTTPGTQGLVTDEPVWEPMAFG
jgi:2,3-dihydroxybenzoate decarboxylase